MEKPKVDLTTIIHYLREKCDKETYAKQIEMVQEYLAVPNTTADKIDVEDVLCRSILVNARRLFEQDVRGSAALPFMTMMMDVKQQLDEWRKLGLHFYGEEAQAPDALRKMIDKRLEDAERGRG